MEKLGGRLIIRTRNIMLEERPMKVPEEHKADSHIELCVRDTGEGMSRLIKDRIFEPYFTTKPMGIGTGLGLSISYDIVTNKHEGYMRVESTVGEGTTFRVGLPTKSLRKDQGHEETKKKRK